MSTFVEKSVPPDTEPLVPETAVAVRQPVAIAKAYDEDLRARCDAFITDRGWSQASFAQQLGVSTGALNKYLKSKPEGDVAKLEARIADVMHKIPLMQPLKIELIETSISRQMENFFNRLIRSRLISVVHGPAGLGKTCGCELFVRDNPTSILITATQWNRSGSAVLNMIWEQIDHRGFPNPKKPGQNRGDFVRDRFRESDRLLIVDNAHRLDKTGFNFVFDLCDATELPVAFVGNPEIIDKLKQLDQHFSRLAPQLPLKLKEEDAAKMARALLETMAPDKAEEIQDLADQIVRHHGHGRALKQRVLMAMVFAVDKGMTVRQALKEVHGLFVGSDYQLAA